MTMENKTTKETNLFDLCVAAWNAFVALCRRIWGIFAGMLRITYRRWWIVLPVMIAFIVFAFWWYRPSNRKYKAEAMFILNGPTLEQFEQRCNQLVFANPFSKTENTAELLGIDKSVAGQIRNMMCFKVYDCQKNNTPDIVDYSRSISPIDTNYVRMEDHVAMRFRFRGDLKSLPVIEKAIVDFFNASEEMQAQFVTYRQIIERDYRFCHEQIDKLDSLTSSLYFNDYTYTAQTQTGVFQGYRGINLPLEDIREHIEQTYKVDQRITQATAPVVLENHIVLVPMPMHDWRKLLVVAFIIGWIMACLFALVIEKRKEINAWLRK